MLRENPRPLVIQRSRRRAGDDRDSFPFVEIGLGIGRCRPAQVGEEKQQRKKVSKVSS
jgi:hypothetical protein